MRLVLGGDAIDSIRGRLDEVTDELGRWGEVGRRTRIDGACSSADPKRPRGRRRARARLPRSKRPNSLTRGAHGVASQRARWLWRHALTDRVLGRRLVVSSR
jgi:hypothetical protein